MTPGGGGLAELLAEGLGVGAGHREVLLELHALGLEAHGEVLEAVLHLAADQRLGQLVGDELGEGLAHLLPQGHLGLGLADPGHAVGQAGPQLVDGLELGGLGGPLVVGLGEHLLLDVLDGDLEVELAGLVGVGVGGVEARACRRPWRRRAARRARGRSRPEPTS